MFIYSNIMHIKAFHNDSFMKNSLFQNDTTKNLSAETLKYIKYLKWFEECFFHGQSAVFSEKL